MHPLERAQITSRKFRCRSGLLAPRGGGADFRRHRVSTVYARLSGNQLERQAFMAADDVVDVLASEHDSSRLPTTLFS